MTNRRIRLFACICVFAQLLCSCKATDSDTLTELNYIKSAYSASLTAVSVYTSQAEIGDEGHVDQGLIAALLGKGGVFPPEMSAVEEYSFFCASSIEVCEVWIAKCRTYSAARALVRLFEKRKAYLSKIDFDSESDAKAAGSAQIIRRGKKVYFIAASCGDAIASYISKKSSALPNLNAKKRAWQR